MNNKFANVDPKNIEMEKFVLSALLLDDGKIIPDINAILSPEDFYRPEHKDIFSAIIKLYKNKVTPNILSLVEELQKTTDKGGKSLLDFIGIEYLLALTEIAHTTAYAEHYAKQIKEKSDFRRLIRKAEEIAEDARAGVKTPLDIIAETQNALNNFGKTSEKKFSNVADYLLTKFYHDIEQSEKYSDRKTDFSNIDKFQSLEPGLYILGATPACGKTTFAWQLLDQMAERGEHCIFCSYEMETKRLAAKTVARKIFIDNRNTEITNTKIINGGGFDVAKEIIHEIFNRKINFDVREFDNEDVNKLLAILRPVVDQSSEINEKAPVICIDYLQRLIPRDKASDTRALIDDALFKLKDFSKETGTTFFVVSTFNRTNYNQLVSFESFKESGGIEYTADVVWAMQLNIANYLSGEKENLIRQKIKDAKKNQPREINLTCLKNRFGNNYDCYFQYFSAHDCFLPCDESDFILSKTDKKQNPPKDDSCASDDDID